ncbi:MAG TPA: DUF1223 domain-containing protein [Steroidobacteraceae bacterium]|nr:DUF1223 domain-containing protein [Steroidobacteraceae bacterium]
MLKPACLRLCVGLALLLAVSGVQAQSRPTVVELYTSEGCSSCPPAEEQVGKLAKQDGIIALAFHVDYWDSLGWHDRFDFPEATARQRQYAHTLKLSTVYTPQLVVDGQRDVVGGGDGIGAGSAKTPGVPVAISVQNNAVVVALGALQPAAACDVLLIAYLPEAVSKVTRGENAGHELHEFNIVRSIRKLGSWQGAGETFSVPLTALTPDATAVAVLVQQRDQGPIVGAASRALR